MNKITIKIYPSEFAELYLFSEKIYGYVRATDINYISDSYFVIYDFYIFLAKRYIVWKIKKHDKEHNLDISLSTAKILASELLRRDISITLQAVLSKIDQQLVNNNIFLKGNITDTQYIQCFSKSSKI